MHEGHDFPVRKLGQVQDIRMDEVEVPSVELQLGLKLLAHVAVVSEFVYQGRAVAVALELALTRLVKGIIERALRFVCCRWWFSLTVYLAHGLAVYHVQKGSVRMRKHDHLSASGGII